MTELEAVTTYLAEAELTALMLLAEKAMQEKKQHQDTADLPNGLENFSRVQISLENLGYIVCNGKTEQSKKLHHSIITLFPAAFHRYNHEKLCWMFKQLNLIRLKYKDFIAIAAFIISVVLLFLRILEMAGYRLVID